MKTGWTRRDFLGNAATIGAGSLGVFGKLPRVSADEARVDAGMVRFRPEIEPLVRLLEETPRERLLEEVGSRIRAGTTHREVVTALMLAGIRNIQPRPVGFKFHAVLVVNSAHLASLNSPASDRWLPIFWALDQFKSSQALDAAEGDWTMDALREVGLPPGDRAAAEFSAGMDAWDPERTDGAAATLARGGDARVAFDLLCRYGARDYRDIGHKAIYVANGFRLLDTIGWQHSEPVLRSLGYALLGHRGTNPAERDALADRPGRRNLERLKTLRKTWNGGENRPDTVVKMLAVLRAGTWDDSAARVVALINAGSGPQPVWDAMFQAAAELLMRRPGIVALHACTTTNALHHAFRRVSDDATRRFVMLQNASFLPMFRADAEAGEGTHIDSFEALAGHSNGIEAVEEIFTTLPGDRLLAARRALAYLEAGGSPQAFTDAAQRLVYLKGTDSHDYKFSSAIIEDYRAISPAFRNRFLAASVFWLKGSGEPESPLVARSRAAF